MVYLYAGHHDAAFSGDHDPPVPDLLQAASGAGVCAPDTAVLLRTGVFHLSDDAVYAGDPQGTG